MFLLHVVTPGVADYSTVHGRIRHGTKQSVFALDFDNGEITIDEVYSRLKELGIVPQLWYTTFSDSPELRKFRVVIFLDTPVTDIRIHKLIHESLFSLFPEVDNVCKDASRYFFGGKELYHSTHGSSFNIWSLLTPCPSRCIPGIVDPFEKYLWNPVIIAD